MRLFLRSFSLLIGLVLSFSVFSGEDKLHLHDFAPDETDSTISQRLVAIQQEIPLTFNKYVRGYIDYYTIRKRDYSRLMISRKEKYFATFEKYLAKYNMPDEIKYLSVVESGLNPKAKSPVGALGLWQFMPETAKEMRLRLDYYVDERMDIEKSTQAACLYLSRLYNTFQDWQLALAAYNCGAGNVRKAKRRSGKQSFWEIYRYLPRETRSYVPIFIAVAYTMNYADEHNLFTDSLIYPIESDSLTVSGYFNFNTFAEETNTCLKDLLDLNPTVKHTIVPDYFKSFTVRYPKEKQGFITQNEETIASAYKTRRAVDTKIIDKAPERLKIRHRVRSGETLGHIARRYHVYTKDIRRWNRISGSTIYIGQRLTIYKKQYFYNPAVDKALLKAQASTKKKTPVKPKPKPAPVKCDNPSYYTVASGDTLWDITQKLDGITTSQLKKWNGLRTSRVYPGQKLRLCN
ncbi:MAG: transglycosylase SLT domain-containing protein [Cyclobacteriaceae bacterium]